jgi:anti-anti-sigma factor
LKRLWCFGLERRVGGKADMSDEVYTHFEVKSRDGICTVRVTSNQIRHPEAAEVFKAELMEVLEREQPRALVIDFEGVNYLGSSIFAVLIAMRGELETRGILYAICGLHPDVELASNIVGLPRLVAMYDDVAAAREAVRQVLERS